VEPGLREIRLGEWEGGLYRHKVVSLDPVALEMFEKERWDVVPGAESNEELATRVRAGIERIAADHPGGRVVAFSHGGAIGMVLSIATGSRPFAFVAVDNGGISTIVVSGDRWFLRGFNDVCHLH
jgi:probable phosphoglycerate mutase